MEYALARHFRPTPIYEALLHQDRIYLPHRGARVSHALERLRVGNAMTKDPVMISATASIGEGLRQVQSDDFSTYPVVANGHSFIGFVTEARLRRTAAEGGGDQPVATILQASVPTQPGDTLVHAVVTMEKSGARQLGVIDPIDGNRLIRLLTMSDIVRAHARAVMDVDDVDRSPPS
jgi:chloride channel protein, CIC family